ncbi:uncharacterized protein LOC123702043 [Colias croceus]|uniref:uncharacterized protein LOC123702043 n=1 Tax=Colias crocea TaxID=72248 RepID=UPI001E28069D|nr:uncharacterized protein LOC123702043 [Colias croceus]
MAEFLPLCDVLFNVISLAGYFCDVVFDLVMGYALLERGYKGTFAATISIVITSLLISQVLSLRWYLHVWWGSEGRKGRPPWLPILLHCLQMGVLWRYARLLVPVELRRVKHQVRDLCMLRLVHAFCEAAPMLLLQLHILLKEAHLEISELGVPPDPNIDEPAANKAFAELNIISASLSLFSVCWALASFSKNVRLQNVHRLVLTWLGVIFQFLWRLGTISARVCALTVYALVYEYWVFLVIGLHWVSMFLWLISPKNVFHGERISRPRKAYLAALIAFVYVFAYVNLQELNHRQKMVIFYCVMCVENMVLVTAWWWAGAPRGPPPARLAPAAAAAFLAGLAAMSLYYRYFHVRRLGYMLGEHQQGTNSTNASSQNKLGKSGQNDNTVIPGVFNCRFSNPVNSSAANGRKKKKPTSFVPPPAGAAPQPFWRRPLPHAHAHTHTHHGGSSENEGSSVGSRVNIQQKLQEKKQKQLAELRVIEEEIKQGKLAKTTPVAAEEIYSSLQRQPIPRAKTHAEPPAWPSIEVAHSYQNYPVLPHTCIYPTYTEIKPDYAENFQNNETSNDIKIRQNIYNQESRTFYENPANLRGENRAVIRSPNYLAINENRNFETRSPRNVLDSPRNAYISDVTSNNYDSAIDKSRPQTNYTDDRQNIEFSNYCETNQPFKYDDKDEYMHNALSNQVDNIRIYNEVGCGQYNQNCERMFPYSGLPGKKIEQIRKMQRCRTPEILLAPHYLEGCNRQVCCHWPGPYGRKKEEGGSSGEQSSPEGNRETPRPPSDIDSQISLPRSYTLPREFRYWRRRPRLRDAHLPSNNSSDGDVDSGDNESDRRSNCSATSQIHPPTYSDNFAYRQPDMIPRQDDRYDVYGACDRRPRRGFRKPGPKPETKL